MPCKWDWIFDLQGNCFSVVALKDKLEIGKILNHQLPEHKICKRFGCGKVLERREYLASDYCTECSQPKNKVHIFLTKDKFKDPYYSSIKLKDK